MRKEPKLNDKSHGPIKSNKAPSKERAKEKKTARNNQETRVKESQNESPKNGMRKIQEMDSN